MHYETLVWVDEVGVEEGWGWNWWPDFLSLQLRRAFGEEMSRYCSFQMSALKQCRSSFRNFKVSVTILVSKYSQGPSVHCLVGHCHCLCCRNCRIRRDQGRQVASQTKSVYNIARHFPIQMYKRPEGLRSKLQSLHFFTTKAMYS